MGYSKAFVLFTLLFVVTVFVSSLVSARDLAEAKPTQTQSVEDAKYGGYGGGGYGHGGYGHGGGRYGGGSYGHGGGGYGGGGYGHGGGGYGHGGGGYGHGGYGHGGGGYGHGGYGGHYPPKAEKTAQENGN